MKVKVYVLLENKDAGDLYSNMQFAGVYGTRGAAGEAVIDALAEAARIGLAGRYDCKVQEHEVDVVDFGVRKPNADEWLQWASDGAVRSEADE